MTLREKIIDSLECNFVDVPVIIEVNFIFDEDELIQQDILEEGDHSKKFPKAISLLDTKAVTQQEISDWAILNGYVCVKVDSIAARLKIEKVIHEIWGADAESHLIGGYEL